jgi:hypothetical protein
MAPSAIPSFEAAPPDDHSCGLPGAQRRAREVGILDLLDLDEVMLVFVVVAFALVAVGMMLE